MPGLRGGRPAGWEGECRDYAAAGRPGWERECRERQAGTDTYELEPQAESEAESDESEFLVYYNIV